MGRLLSRSIGWRRRGLDCGQPGEKRLMPAAFGSAGDRAPEWPDVLRWFETIDAIVQGMVHTLNNRALSLGATIEALDPRRPVSEPVASGLSREAQRLTEQLRQLRALPFALGSEPMPLLLGDVLGTAIQLHRSHASLGDVAVYLEAAADAPPILAPEPAFIHAVLMTLTQLKGFVAPGGVVRVACSGTADEARLTFIGERDASDPHDGSAEAVMRPTVLTAALLGGANLEIEQRIGLASVVVVWRLPSLRAMRQKARSEAQAG